MKGGMQFADDKPPKSGDLSLCIGGKKTLQYKKKKVRTHSKLKDGQHLYFNLYNIESFHEYENKTFDLSDLGDDMKDINSIEHLYLCGFLTKWDRKELFIKKGKAGEEGNNEGNKASNKAKHFKDIGKILYELCQKIKNDHEERTNKIQIILAHSTEKNALCIIFNMSNIDESYYDSLKKSLPYTSFSDDKISEGKIKQSQLENLIEFTNEKLNIEAELLKSKTRFLLGLLLLEDQNTRGQLLSALGGGIGNNTKELRKKLNTMSIKQLKILSDKNHIKYGNKNTIKSLINNYMKHI